MVFGWKGSPFIMNMLISIIGAIIITNSGYSAFAPFAMLIGAFIAGLLYKDARDGAVFGFLAAGFIAGIISIFFLLIYTFLVITIFLILAIPQYLAAISLFSLILFIAVLLSPVTGAVGGFSGSKFFGKEEETTPPTPQSFQSAPIPPNTAFCPSCGVPNDLASNFCVSCGSSLKVL